jgi:hypothetical protein
VLPISVTTCKFDVDETLRVVELIKGIVKVSKLKVIIDAFDVKPAVYIFVVVTEFAA